jgi:hypothetical protein
MKTSIELSDALFLSAKEHASATQTTLRALIEEGLRRVLSDGQAQHKPAFKLRNAAVGGGTMLISDPRQWQQLEENHVMERFLKTQSMIGSDDAQA